MAAEFTPFFFCFFTFDRPSELGQGRRFFKIVMKSGGEEERAVLRFDVYVAFGSGFH